MSWQKIKGLKEQRAATITKMEGIVKTGEDEKRDLNAEESGQFDTLRAEADRLGNEVERLNAIHNGKDQIRDFSGTGRPAGDAIVSPFAGYHVGGGAADDPTEARRCGPMNPPLPT